MAHVYMGGWNRAPRERETGTLLTDDVIEKIVPGSTTLDEVLALAGPDAEQHERLAPQRAPDSGLSRPRRPARDEPHRSGWFFTVRHFDVEEHMVTVELRRQTSSATCRPTCAVPAPCGGKVCLPLAPPQDRTPRLWERIW